MTTSFDLDARLGVKSYSFRHIKENPEVAAAVKQCAVKVIDLSACHVNYDDPAQQEQVIAAYRDAGVTISGIGVVTLKNDEVFNRRFFEFARRAGCGLVSCSLDPDAHEDTLRLTRTLCDRYGMRIAIHNHGGKHWLGNSTMLDYLFRRTGPEVGLCLDTAWCIQAGESPLTWLERFGDRLYGLHLKDFTFEPKGTYHDTVVGEGALDLPAFLKALRTAPALESAVVEYEGDDAVGMTARCVKAIRAACS
ncbi:MAG: sugar phosphate isomerase [Rariglobus sp.]|jgi:sugar phosphate isomerase/epimerase|nr:sugar phosphate isomerase [Rariglobus sp.]